MDENLIEQFFDLPVKDNPTNFFKSPSTVYDKMPNAFDSNSDNIFFFEVFSPETDRKIREFLSVESPDYLGDEEEEIVDFYSDEFVMQQATDEYNQEMLEILDSLGFDFDDTFLENFGEFDDEEDDLDEYDEAEEELDEADEEDEEEFDEDEEDEDEEEAEDFDEEEEDTDIDEEDELEFDWYITRDDLDDDILTNTEFFWSQMPWDEGFRIDPEADVFNMFVDIFYNRWVQADGWDAVFCQEYHDEIRYMEERLNFYDSHNDFVGVSFFSVENFIKVFFDFLYLSYDVIDDGFRYFVLPYYKDFLEFRDTSFDYTNSGLKKPSDLAHEAYRLENDYYKYTPEDLELFKSTPWEKVNEVFSDDKWIFVYNIATKEEYESIQNLPASQQLLCLDNYRINDIYRHYADPYDEGLLDDFEDDVEYIFDADGLVFSSFDNKIHFLSWDDFFSPESNTLILFDKSDFGLYTDMIRLKPNYDDLMDSFVLEQSLNKEYFFDGMWLWYDYYVFAFFFFFVVFFTFFFFYDFLEDSSFARLIFVNTLTLLFIYYGFTFGIDLLPHFHHHNQAYAWFWINYVFLEDLILKDYSFFFDTFSRAFMVYFYYYFLFDIVLNLIEDEWNFLLEDFYNINEKADHQKKFDEFVDMTKTIYSDTNTYVFDDEPTFNIKSATESDLDDFDYDLDEDEELFSTWKHTPEEFFEIYLREKEMDENIIKNTELIMNELMDAENNPTSLKDLIYFINVESEILYVGAFALYIVWKLS